MSAVRGDDGYWRLRVAVRRYGDEWDESGAQVYSGLTTDELEDTLACALAALLQP